MPTLDLLVAMGQARASRVSIDSWGHGGFEVIGHEHPLEGRPSREIKSRFYDASSGLTLDYVYELTGRMLKIWFGPKGSNNRYVGKFSPDGNGLSGAWKWPGGG